MEKKTIVAVIIILVVAGALTFVQNYFKDSSVEDARAEYAAVVADEVINGEVIGDLDRTTYDEDVMCIAFKNKTLTTVAPNLDGDEVNFSDISHNYFLAKDDTKYYREDTQVIIHKDESKTTTITYEEITMEDVIDQVEENVLPANMHIWLDKKDRASIIMMYGETTIWE